MFQFTGFAYRLLGIMGLPHSDTHGSKAVCAYPWLFAAYRVLLRLCVPRHPPCALICFLFDTPSQGCARFTPRKTLVTIFSFLLEDIDCP